MDKYSYLGVMNEGEKRLYSCCKQFESENFKLIPDALFERADNGTNQIDLMCITKKGIFVLEMKDFRGWIFGDENHKEWIQSIKGSYGLPKKYKFRNPVKQNENHIKTIRRILSERGYSIPIYNIVVFGDDAVLKEINTSIDVINLSEIKSIFDKYPEIDIALDKLQSIGELFSSKNIKSKEDRVKHLQYVEGIRVEKNKSGTDAIECTTSNIKMNEMHNCNGHTGLRKPKNRTKSRKPIKNLFIAGIALYIIVNLMSGNSFGGKDLVSTNVNSNENASIMQSNQIKATKESLKTKKSHNGTNDKPSPTVKENNKSSASEDSKTTPEAESKESSLAQNSSTADSIPNTYDSTNAAVTLSNTDNELLLENIVGIWTGTYKTNKNFYNAKVEITKSEDKSYLATFSFETSLNDTSVIKGEYIMDISFNESTKTINFKGSKWLNRPRNYVMVDFETVLKDSQIEGKVISSGQAVGTVGLRKSASNSDANNATTASSIYNTFIGIWDGSYTAYQGVTKVKIIVSQNADGNLIAEVNIGPHEKNPNLPQGKWLANLSVNDDTKRVEFKQSKWVNQPSGWNMVDFMGVFKETYIEGNVMNNGQQIGEFKVEK
jgi:hypothetical protein